MAHYFETFLKIKSYAIVWKNVEKAILNYTEKVVQYMV